MAAALGTEALSPKVYDNVARLDTLYLPNDPPQIQVPSNAIAYDIATVPNAEYEDKIAYATEFTEETKQLAEMASLLKTGDKFISILYTYRSCSKAMPMVQIDTADDQKLAIHQQTFNILRPQIQKLKELMEFHENAVRLFSQNLATLVKPEQKKQVHSEVKLDYLVQIIDMLIVLDALKDMKACLQNDFSRYKRAFASIRGDLNDADVISEEIHNLQMFLGNPQHPHHLIIYHLKSDIHKISGFDDVLVLLLDHCCDILESERFLFASEKHAHQRVIPFLIYLIDSDEKDGQSVFKSKKVRMDRIFKLFRHVPVVPLYGDMKISVMWVLKKCVHWQEEMESQWLTTKEGKLDRCYLLLYHREKIRKEYNEFTSSFIALINTVKSYQSTNRAITQLLPTIFKQVLTGLKLLNSWSAKVIEQSAWKYENPINEEEYKRQNGKHGENKEYEKVVRFNYSPEELYALVDVIGMIKGLGGLMMKHEVDFIPLTRQAIHDDFQIFLQKEVARPLRKAFKRKRPVKDVMIAMREIAGDWADPDKKEDYKDKKKILVNKKSDFPRRAAAPTATQILLIRRMMHSIFSPRAPGMQGGLFTDKDLKKEWIPVWEEFYQKSFYFSYLLNFSKTLRESTDMSQLWYREFYLEMTKCVQFPIGMSMPWILTEFIIKTPSIKENLFFPIDIYNDAAQRSLDSLSQQFLYDEIEAECNLAFDQLVFTLSEEIFKYYKSVAASVLVDKPLKDAYAALKRGGAAALTAVNSRYESLMAQRNVQLLGRAIDLQMLIASHVNGYLRRNLEYVITRYEASDLTSVIELQSLLNNFKLAHALLAEHLPVDPFHELFAEVNEDTAVGQFRGRIVMHTFAELISDFFPNFLYNSITKRFVRGRVTFVDPPVRDNPPKNVPSYYWYGSGFKDVQERVAGLTKGFFGYEHMEALLDVLDFKDVPLLVNEVLSNAEYMVTNVLAEYSRELVKALQPVKLQRQLGVIGAFGSFDLKLKFIKEYNALRPVVFQTMRELGNMLAFILLLEMASEQVDDLAFQQSSFFLGIKRKKKPTLEQLQTMSEDDVQDTFVRPNGPAPFATIMKAAAQHLANSQPNFKPLYEAAVAGVGHAEHLYDHVLDHSSLFAAALHRLNTAIDRSVRNEWKGVAAPNGVIDVENPKDFVRLFSSLQFIFCSTQISENKADDEELTDIEMFGDGWCWAGCALIHLMGFRHRFEFMDFVYHVLKVNTIDPAPTQSIDIKSLKKGQKLSPDQEMIPRIITFLRDSLYVKDINNYVFSLLDNYYPIASASESLYMQTSAGAAPPSLHRPTPSMGSTNR